MLIGVLVSRERHARGDQITKIVLTQLTKNEGHINVLVHEEALYGSLGYVRVKDELSSER